MTSSKLRAAPTAATMPGGGASSATALFQAVTVVRNGTIDLDLPPRLALLLFTAPGERLWITEWDPVILQGDGFETGTVFVTTNHGPTTYWFVSDFDEVEGHAQYVRVTPESDLATVDVTVTAGAGGGSTVSITYQVTGLTPDGNRKIATIYRNNEYRAMMEKWRGLIHDNRTRIDEYFRDT